MPIPRPTCLHDHNHQAARHPPCVTPLLPYYARHHGKASGPAAPEGTGGRQPTMRPDASDRTVANRYGNINPFIHSTTPVGLALGPDSPGDDERGPGTLGHPADGILTRLSLLMSAFSLPQSPRHGHPAASPLAGRSPTRRAYTRRRVFGGVLEPRYIVGAGPLDQ